MSSNTKKLSLKEHNAACSEHKNKELKKRTEERMERKRTENGQARMIKTSLLTGKAEVSHGQ